MARVIDFTADAHSTSCKVHGMTFDATIRFEFKTKAYTCTSLEGHWTCTKDGILEALQAVADYLGDTIRDPHGVVLMFAKVCIGEPLSGHEAMRIKAGIAPSNLDMP